MSYIDQTIIICSISVPNKCFLYLILGKRPRCNNAFLNYESPGLPWLWTNPYSKSPVSKLVSTLVFFYLQLIREFANTYKISTWYIENTMS